MNIVWAAMNMFVTEMTIESSKSRQEVISAIKANTETENSKYTPFKTIGKSYYGSVDDSSFTIKEVGNDRYETKPLIRGSVDEKGEGASVYVRISKARNEIIIYLIVALNYLALLYAIIQEILTTGKVEGYFLAGGLVITFIIAGGIIFRKYKAKTLKRDITRIIQGPEFREYH